MSEPLISVVIPAYNVARFVEEAIRSIMCQTYRHLEIIVVDDCSTDQTYAILQKLAAEDSRLRIFRNEQNRRIVDTLNFGLTQASGAFIVRMDADDVSLPDRIEKQYEFLVQHPEYDLVGVNVTMIDEQGQKIHDEAYVSTHEAIVEASRYVSPVPHFWLTKKAVYDAVGPYRIPSAEDLDFILRAIDRGYKLFNLPDYLYLQRQRRGNTATSLGLLQMKSIAYVRRLHAERAANGSMKDSYTPEGLTEALRTTDWERKRFDLAARFHYQYVENKNRSKLAALLYRMAAVVIAPKHQLWPMYNRWKYNGLKERVKHNQ